MTMIQTSRELEALAGPAAPVPAVRVLEALAVRVLAARAPVDPDREVPLALARVARGRRVVAVPAVQVVAVVPQHQLYCWDWPHWVHCDVACSHAAE